MFGRRRHRAPVTVAPPVPVVEPGIQLSEEQLFEKVSARLDAHMGSTGDWTLVRRSDADTDTFFHEMAAFSLAREITTAIVGTPTAVEQPETVTELAAAESINVTPAPIMQTITVRTVPSSASSGAADVGPTVFDAPADSDALPVELSKVEHVMFELNSVAVWADPQRHDPAWVNPELVTPTVSRAKKRWNGTRVS